MNQKEIIQLIRKYQSGFIYVNEKTDWRTIQICLVPTQTYKDLGLDFQFTEGWLKIEISFSRIDYINKNNKYIEVHLKNKNIPKSFKKHFRQTFQKQFKKYKNLVKTLRHIDNYLD